jgi:hypothetical protein
VPGLPDGIFWNKNRNLGKFWSVLQWKMSVIFKDIRSILLLCISYILWPFGIFCLHLGIFLPVLVCCTKKIWQPCSPQKFFIISSCNWRSKQRGRLAPLAASPFYFSLFLSFSTASPYLSRSTAERMYGTTFFFRHPNYQQSKCRQNY